MLIKTLKTTMMAKSLKNLKSTLKKITLTTSKTAAGKKNNKVSFLLNGFLIGVVSFVVEYRPTFCDLRVVNPCPGQALTFRS